METSQDGTAWWVRGRTCAPHRAAWAARGLRRLAAVAVLVAMGIAFVALPVTATTGPTTVAHPPHFRIARRAIVSYLGRYRTPRESVGSRIVSSDILIKYGPQKFVEGGYEMYNYAPQGYIQGIDFALYDFHAVHGRILASLVDATGNYTYGEITIQHVGRGRSIAAVVRPKSYGQAGPVDYQYVGPEG